MDIMDALLKLAQQVTRFNDISGYRLKVKFCALCDGYLDHAESLSIRKNAALRVGIADYVVEWAQDPTAVSASLRGSFHPADARQYPDAETARMLREINYATLRTAVKLFDRLELQSEEEQQKDEPGHNVARLFIRYSSFLFKMLGRLDPSVRTSAIAARLAVADDAFRCRTVCRSRQVIRRYVPYFEAMHRRLNNPTATFPEQGHRPSRADH